MDSAVNQSIIPDTFLCVLCVPPQADCGLLHPILPQTLFHKHNFMRFTMLAGSYINYIHAGRERCTIEFEGAGFS